MTLNDIMGCGLTAAFLRRCDGGEITDEQRERLTKLGFLSDGALTEKAQVLCGAILFIQEPVSVTRWEIPDRRGTAK
jgi:hypothetical protein